MNMDIVAACEHETEHHHESPTDGEYEAFHDLIAWRVASITGPVFTTDADPEVLWGAYLSGLPSEVRQHYNCHACRRFIQAYGGLVTVGGFTASAIFHDPHEVPGLFATSVQRLATLASTAKITGVHYSSEHVWGTLENADKHGHVWTHLSGRNPNVYRNPIKSASQAMAEKLEEHGMLCRGLSEYPRTAAVEALRVLRSEVLPGTEKALGIAEWFASLHGKQGHELWIEVAKAPAGWCHIKATMISTLLDDIMAGMSFDTIKRRWSEKMAPLQYRRPTAPPKAGNIEQAEKLVETLGLARSLERRIATAADVPECERLWTPAVVEASGSVFGHLKARTQPERLVIDLTRKSMSWEKFSAEILPGAKSLEYLPTYGMHGFYGLTAAVHEDAPGLFQWPNTVGWYFYASGSTPMQWGLAPDVWVPVTMAFLAPYNWGRNKAENFPRRVMLALEGAKDSSVSCLGLFPAMIRSDLHGILSVIEAHSNRKLMVRHEAENVNGIAISKTDHQEEIRLRVNGSEVYTVDRWERS